MAAASSGDANGTSASQRDGPPSPTTGSPRSDWLGHMHGSEDEYNSGPASDEEDSDSPMDSSEEDSGDDLGAYDASYYSWLSLALPNDLQCTYVWDKMLLSKQRLQISPEVDSEHFQRGTSVNSDLGSGFGFLLTSILRIYVATCLNYSGSCIPFSVSGTQVLFPCSSCQGIGAKEK